MPNDLGQLDGHEFIAAIPALEQRARSGNIDALRLLFRRLQDCTDYRYQSDDEIRESADERYQHDLKMFPAGATCPGLAPNGCSPEKWRDDLVASSHQRRDRCMALSPRTLETRLDWARLALERGDRRMILDLGGVGFFSLTAPERMRNVEKLIELERLERNALGRLIEACDLDAMRRAAFGFSTGGPLWGSDVAAAHSYMRMLQRAGGANGDEPIQDIFARSAPALSPAQLAEADRRGQQMFEQHCTQG